MFEKWNEDYKMWIFIALAMIILEVFFFNHGLIFSIIIEIGMIYIGRKWMPKTRGKVLFWLGILLFAITIFNMMAFKLLILALIVHFGYQFYLTKKKPKKVQPRAEQRKADERKEAVVQKKNLLTNKISGHQNTSEEVYEWGDINIQCGLGDTEIDLSYTVLPNQENIIFIKNLIGNVRIYIPYDVEVSINHSVIVGSSQIFDLVEKRAFNRNYIFETENYNQTEQKVKIVTSLIVGDIEVKRS
ncbi:cell wall-active antibiotics response protein LiaF [Cytobacillus sp. FSL R7-0696]|uniref:cell wall-active antibiotics response protein LiaF n=1 Tax=Cytobacillus sp. FSL R7-0696 TaxID=2921691 RepID=UPI0030FCC001